MEKHDRPAEPQSAFQKTDQSPTKDRTFPLSPKLLTAFGRIERLCSSHYSQAVYSGRILEEAEVLELAALPNELITGACLANVFDGAALKAFKANPRTGAQMLEERHQERIKSGGYDRIRNQASKSK